MYNFDLDFTYDNDKEYQHYFLKCFDLEEYDEEMLPKKMDELYEYLIKCDDIKNLFKSIANTYTSEDLSMGYAFLFSYTYFLRFYKLISEYHKSGKVNQVLIESIMSKI